MNHIDTFDERLYSPIDTIWDFFSDSLYLNAVENFKKNMIDEACDAERYKNYSHGDVLREIFSSDENLSKYLSIIKEDLFSNENDTTKIVTFILACEQVRRSIDNTPCSIKEIFSQRILEIMQKLGQENYPPEDGIDEGEIFWTYNNGLHQMKAMWFPIISKAGVPVYFYDTAENPEIIFVWSKETWIVKYDKSGEIQVEIVVEWPKKPVKRVIPPHLRVIETLATE